MIVLLCTILAVRYYTATQIIKSAVDNLYVNKEKFYFDATFEAVKIFASLKRQFEANNL